MATFSTSDALASGFRLIGKRPLSVLAWGMVYLVLGVLPVLALFGTLGPDILGLIRQAAEAAKSGVDHEPDAASMMAVHARMMVIQPVALLAGLVSQTLVSAAIFRAVLEPRNRGFAYLRLGAKELWLALTTVVLGVLLFLAALCILAVVGIVCALIVMGARAAGAPEGLQAVVIALGVIAGVVALVWVAARLSLALPMTFADGQFRVFESWSLTRGHAGQLFLLGLILLIILTVVGAVAQGAALAGGLSMARGMPDIEAFFARPPGEILQAVGPWLIVGLVLLCIVRAALMAIFLAPWAHAYRQLTAPAEPA